MSKNKVIGIFVEIKIGIAKNIFTWLHIEKFFKINLAKSYRNCHYKNYFFFSFLKLKLTEGGGQQPASSAPRGVAANYH